MVNRKTLMRTLFTSLLLILSAFPGLSQAQDENLSAFVDRTDVSVNDVITLTIRVGSLLGTSRPSLNTLNNDFDQLGTTTSSSFTNNNGQVSSWTEYRVSLKPKSTGTFTIPSFRVASESTLPIPIKVTEATTQAGASSNEIFLSTTVDKESIYVQEQLIFTIKLYYSVRFDQGAQLSTPQVSDSVIQQLGSDENYMEIVEGIRYDVTERKYVIFPQSSGELFIPPIYFTASIGGRSGLSRLLSRTTPVRQINLNSESHTIEIKGIPASFNGQTWLPAASLNVEESWSEDTANLNVGDSITRNLTIVTQGLSSSLLPALQYDDVTGLRFYPDQPNREDTANRNGVIGSRAEGTAIVASLAGEFTMPALDIPWWNTQTDEMETAHIPSRTISVTGIASPTGQEPGNINIISGVPANGLTANSEFTTQQNPLNTLWISTTVLFALAWLATSFLWLRNKQLLTHAQQLSPFISSNEKTKDIDEKLPTLSTSFSYLQQTCKNKDLPTLRKALLGWGQSYFQTRNINTLDQLQARCESEPLSQQIFSLERALYGNTQDQSAFNPQTLLKEISSLTTDQKDQEPTEKKKGKKEDLPPLYKN